MKYTFSLSTQPERQRATLSLYVLNSLLLATHIILEFYYYCLGAHIMAIVNIFSILFYSMSFISLNKKDFSRYGYATYGEICVHSILATVLIGWDAGFQLWLVAIISAYFFPHFEDPDNRHTKKGLSSSIFFGVGAFIAYMTLFVLHAARITSSFAKKVSPRTILLTNGMNSFIVFTTVLSFTFVFVRRLNKTQERLNDMALHDSLTGLFNRYALTPVIEEAENIANAKQSTFSVAIADLDHFKQINDTYGHDTGDYVLREFAKILQEESPENTVVGRWGGEEFLIVMAGDMETMGIHMEALRKRIEGLDLQHKNHKIPLTISIGYAGYHIGDTLQKTLLDADQMLYEAKESGRNIVKP